MGLKKRSEVSAEFSMSSLTDIIFLLLIFFMLTSTLVQIQPFDLPESDSKTVASTDIVVSIDEEGVFMLNNKEISKGALKKALALKKQEVNNQENPYVTIVSEVNNKFNETLYVMKIANELRMKTIIATQPTKL
ncbi:MAG: biopolymer transporter ExbD [Bacteroidota bacterium]